MSRKDFLRFPSDKEAEKYRYQRTGPMVITITACVGLCVLFLALYAALRSPLLFTAAGISAGIAIALWYVSKGPDNEQP